MKKLLLFFFLVQFFCGAVLSENSRFYTSGQLTCNMITKICQDARGFIWVGTEYGLNKFNGIQFTQYLNNEADSTTLKDNLVRELYLDRNQRLWIGGSNGVQYYLPDNDTFCSVPFEYNLRPSVMQILQLHSGELWLIASERGLYKVDCQSNIVQRLNEVNKLCGTSRINYIYEDRFDRLWVGTANAGLRCFDPSHTKVASYTTPELLGNSVTRIMEDKEGTLFIVASGVLLMYEEASEKFIPVKSMDGWGADIRDMTLTKGGVVYVSTFGKGLYVVDKENRVLRRAENIHTPFFNATSGKMVAMIEDRNENLWLGCFQKGVLMIPARSSAFGFWDFSDKEYDKGGTITSVYRDGQGSVWGGLENEGLFKFNKKGKIVKHIAGSQTIISMLEDSDHSFWVGTYYDGLARLDTCTGQCHFLPAFRKTRIKSLVEDSRKNLYVAVFGEGIKGYHLPTGSVWELGEKMPESKRFIKNRWINILLCDSKDLIWIGHYRGVDCYDARNDCFLQIEGDSILDDRVCYSLLEDHKGNIWMGTNNGLYMWNRGNKLFKRYSTVDGLSNNVICGLAEDRNGDIWCSTFRGINQIKLTESRIINYYTGNGLIDKEYARGVYFHDKEDNIYWGGNYGITYFSPVTVLSQGFQQEVMITDMYIGNLPVTANTYSGGKKVIAGNLLDVKDFCLSYEDNTFTFVFSTMDFREPDNIYYEYRLKELSVSWSVTLSGVNRITYSHLASGDYTLEVRACENGSYTPVKQVRIHIAPPWYRSMQAYICYSIFLVALLIQAYLLLRRKRKEEINEAKLKFFINISHEIRSPLTLIISPLETLLKRDNDETTRVALQSMYKNATRIIGLINQLLDIRKIDKGQMRIRCSKTDLVGFVDELYQTFVYQAEKRKIAFVFEHEMDELLVWIDRNNFDKVLINLFSNAFKYTSDGGEIKVTLTMGEDKRTNGALRNYAEISIIDTGQGIDEKKLDKIFDRFYQIPQEVSYAPLGFGIGLNLCKLLIGLHHGTISASNRKDRKGSCFTLRIPLGNSHLKKDEVEDKPTLVSEEVLKGITFDMEEPIEKKRTKRSKTNYKILVIDDDEAIRDFLYSELSATYRVTVSTNGVEGLRMVLTLQPDLVISDVVMPGMDGFTLLQKIKGNSNSSHIPVILLTTKTTYVDRIKGLEHGADGYLSKPFVMDELLGMISNLISNRLLLKGKFSGVRDQEDKVKAMEIRSNDEVLMERIMNVMNEHLANSELSVEMLAEQVGLSRAQLHRKLKELTGIPASEFIRNIRLKQAAKLLKEKKMNISQIAYAVGFVNNTHFSTAFKKYYGVSPTEYISFD